ncbi:MAG: penicillin-binding protein 2 [Sciscionella sp.]|nr:penicillin-binding protein 2 [Sciscionella sp.]
MPRATPGTPGQRQRRPSPRVYSASRRTAAPEQYPRRITVGKVLLVAALVAAGLKLIDVQAVNAKELSAAGEKQRATVVDIPAQRGEITDRNGTKLAFSVDAKALAYHPVRMRQQWNQASGSGQTQGTTFDQHTQAIADYLRQRLGGAVNEADVLTKLRSTKTFVYLDENVDPGIAADIVNRFPDVETEDRAVREYPSGPVASNIIGVANWRKDVNPPGTHGLTGLESSMDNQLAGTPGKQLVDTEAGNNNVEIPGTTRDLASASPGESVQLTIDSDLQFQVQQMLTQYISTTGAKDGSAVVLDAHTGEVYALASEPSFDPNNLTTLDPTKLGDPAVTTPYEPGSVAKLITAAAVVDGNVAKPTDTIDVPSRLKNADHWITDDWAHPDQRFTVTGVFGKSSNIGTVELARRVGPQNFIDMAHKLGLGQRTGIELPGESAGMVPPMSTWSGSTFGNLPFGQGMSMTVLQMADMYQAIANGGVRVPPRIIDSETKSDGSVVTEQRPAGVRVVSAQSAKTVRDMLRSVVQDAPSPNKGTGAAAAVAGYQISGKTGTAQMIDPACNCYSLSQNRVTFAGILPSDSPRFVVGIMLTGPHKGLDGGQTAAPLFHDIAVYMIQHYHIPVSAQSTPYMPLVVG